MTTTHDDPTVVIRADHVPGPPQGGWTYADYAALPDDGHRYEIIDGVLYMAPAPNTAHQAAVVLFTTYLTIHVQFAGLGHVFVAPTDVRLLPHLDPVQPDVVVVLTANRVMIQPGLIEGAPDLVVEVASPSTTAHDRGKKLDAYAWAGVREYWLADPFERAIEVLVLEEGQFRSRGRFRGADTLPSRVVPGLPVPVDAFFAS